MMPAILCLEAVSHLVQLLRIARGRHTDDHDERAHEDHELPTRHTTPYRCYQAAYHTADIIDGYDCRDGVGIGGL